MSKWNKASLGLLIAEGLAITTIAVILTKRVKESEVLYLLDEHGEIKTVSKS